MPAVPLCRSNALVADVPDRRSERIVADNRPEWSMNGFGDNSLM